MKNPPRQPSLKRSLVEAFRDDLNDVDATAQLAHLGQKRRSGEDYITHPQEVAKLIQTFYPGDDLARHVAMLHDTFEDGPSNGTDEETLRSMIRGSIQSEEDAENVVDAISYLTHEPGGDYTSYVANLANSNKLALRVKLADMLHNLQSNPTPKQKAKYGDAIMNLGGKPKGISPLHWKLLLSAAQPTQDAAVNEQVVSGNDDRVPTPEELMSHQVDFMNAYQKWVDSGSFERAVRSYVSEYVHNSNLTGNAAPSRRGKIVEEAIKLLWDDPLNILEDEFNKGEVESLVQDPFSAELFYEGSLPADLYKKLTYAIQNDLSDKLGYYPKETFQYETVKRNKKKALAEQQQMPPTAAPQAAMPASGSPQDRLDTWLHDIWQKNHMEEIYNELEAIASFKGTHLTPPEVGQEMFNTFEQNIIDEVPFADVSVGLAQEQQALRDTIVRGLTKVAQRLWASAISHTQDMQKPASLGPEADPYAYYGVSRDDF